jgi:hypothetical protein
MTTKISEANIQDAALSTLLTGDSDGGSSSGNAVNTQGSGGAVRIIWGTGRAFPATLTIDQTQ